MKVVLKNNLNKDSIDMELLSKASKKQLLQQLGSDPQAAEISDWLSNSVKRDDVQQWFLRNYKKDPKIWNSQNKEAVQHYVGTAGTNPDHDIGKIRFDKSHSFEDGMKLWKDAEDSLKNKKKDASNLLKPDDKTKKLIDLGNGWGWYDLGKGYDADEGSAMAHCGNVNAQGVEDYEDHPNHNDRILSLRKEHNIDGEIYHEPRLSFIENNGYIGESKGFGNSKPAAKYHDAIVQLLKHPRIKENVGGGYAPNNNFYLNDLPKEKLDKLLKDKPNLEKLWKLSSGEVDPNQYPEKHLEEAEAHNQAFKDLRDGNPDMSQARFRDIDPKYAKGLISDLINDPERYTFPLRNDILNMMNSPHLDASHVDLALSACNKKLLPYLLSSHAATKDHMYRAFDSKDPEIRVAAVESPHFGKEHMDRALNDKDQWVRRVAVQSPHFGLEHMDRALKDKSLSVREAAMESPHYQTYLKQKGLAKSMNKTTDSEINIITYSDGTLDIEFGADVSEVLEKSAVEYIRSQGYDEILEKGLKAEHKNPKGGMTAAGVKSYRREHPGSKLQTAVTEKSPKGKRAKRRRSFCSRMSGMPGPMKDSKGKPTRKALALRRWRC